MTTPNLSRADGIPTAHGDFVTWLQEYAVPKAHDPFHKIPRELFEQNSQKPIEPRATGWDEMMQFFRGENLSPILQETSSFKFLPRDEDVLPNQFDLDLDRTPFQFLDDRFGDHLQEHDYHYKPPRTNEEWFSPEERTLAFSPKISINASGPPRIPGFHSDSTHDYLAGLIPWNQIMGSQLEKVRRYATKVYENPEFAASEARVMETAIDLESALEIRYQSCVAPTLAHRMSSIALHFTIGYMNLKSDPTVDEHMDAVRFRDKVDLCPAQIVETLRERKLQDTYVSSVVRASVGKEQYLL